jgi:hypothetical protein
LWFKLIEAGSRITTMADRTVALGQEFPNRSVPTQNSKPNVTEILMIIGFQILNCFRRRTND